MGNGQYTEAIAALKQLQNRVTDPDSAMYKAIEDLLDKAQSAQSDDQFNSDLDEAQSYLDDKKYDAASGKLDSLANDDSLTADQKKQVKELQKQLSDAQQQEKQQEENSQKKAEQRDAFSKKMDELESDDLKISSAANQEDELAMTASSFEQWDNLLGEMYDYLATVLNADQYASEEASYKQWVQERDSGAENAAKETEDDTAKQLASYSFKQSYTKTRCYKLLDLMKLNTGITKKGRITRPFCLLQTRNKGAKKRRFLAKTTLCVSLIIKNELLTLRCRAEEQCDVHA